MKVGIDAKWFFKGNPSGKIVITNLLKELIHNFPNDQFYVFLDKRDKVFEFPFKANNVKIIYVRCMCGVCALYVYFFRNFYYFLTTNTYTNCYDDNS